MATQSSLIVGRIPWTEEAGSLQLRGRKELDMTTVTSHTTSHYANVSLGKQILKKGS